MKRISTIALLLLFVSTLFFNFNFKQEKGIKKTVNYSWLKDGDILFQDTGGDLGEAIKIATKSKYSHCGMIIKEGNNVQVFEAIGPVQYTPINDWIKHGNNNSFKAYRLKKPEVITTTHIKTWKLKAIDYLGKAYDHVFGWNDDKIYCSELVWKMYKNIGIEISIPKKLKDFDLSHKLVKQQLKMRYGTAIPYEEKVVSPQDLLESKLFIEVKN